jgi:hypothetical protein
MDSFVLACDIKINFNIKIQEDYRLEIQSLQYTYDICFIWYAFDHIYWHLFILLIHMLLFHRHIRELTCISMQLNVTTHGNAENLSCEKWCFYNLVKI